MRIAAICLTIVAFAASAEMARSAGKGLREFGIYQIRIDGSGRTQLLKNPEIRNVADLSPDRRELLFRSSGELYAAAIDGTDMRLVLPRMENRLLTGPAAW